mmetsp:Transcript_24793/g.45292  ORF Transcript_24793/g.45292 Transcript_24793/m.45292 type:complete len:325 (-) Transcript_24793:310-1284(-)
MPTQRFGGAHKGLVALAGENVFHGAKLLQVANRGRGAVRVDVVHLLVASEVVGLGDGQLHARLAAHARGGHHVEPVRVGAVPHELSVDLGPARFGVLQLFEDHDAAPTRNHEPVAGLVEGAARRLRHVVVLGREGAHGIKHGAELPALCLPRAREHDVGFAELDLLHPRADAVRARRARRRNRVRHALQLERRREHRRHRASHGLGNAVRAHPLHLVVALRVEFPSVGRHPRLARVNRIRHVVNRGAALPQNGGRPRALVLLFRQPTVVNGALHGNVRVLRVDAHEAKRFSVDGSLDGGLVEVGLAAHPALEPHLRVLLRGLDA